MAVFIITGSLTPPSQSQSCFHELLAGGVGKELLLGVFDVMF